MLEEYLAQDPNRIVQRIFYICDHIICKQLPETEAKEGREVKAWKDLSQISLDPHLCYDHPYQGALKSSWLYYNHLEGGYPGGRDSACSTTVFSSTQHWAWH